MTVHTRCLVLPSTYRDSVVLMSLSRTLEDLHGVRQVAVMMGTPQNTALLRQTGLLTAEAENAGANDLLICVQADSATAVEQAVRAAKDSLAPRQSNGGAPEEDAPRTLETALRRLPEANLACISVPGQYAGHEARKALAHGLHVFLFSDHVGLDEEAELKQFAAPRGLLVMGPDCGTAILNGVPIGFANQVPRGTVGLISASGTGLQQVTCLLAQQGIGVSQAIGVGGRDVHQRIAGWSMRAALHALARDGATRVIVLISKPPDVTVWRQLVREAYGTGKPCVLAVLGDAGITALQAPLYAATTLEEATLVASALIRGEPVVRRQHAIPPHLMASLETRCAALQPAQRAVCALYCGGSLAHEAWWLLQRSLRSVAANFDGPLAAVSAPGHVVLDLGAEEFTSGRPHPMIDPTVRRQQLLAVAQRPDVAVVLCDVMLGWGAHANPAGELAAAWAEAQQMAHAAGRQLLGIATVCGTPDDPQDYTQQQQILHAHGFIVAESNAQAARLAIAAVGGRMQEPQVSLVDVPSQEMLMPAECGTLPPVVPAQLSSLFVAGPRVINVGLRLFAEQLATCGVPVVHVDWRPPAGGDVRLARLLERLR
jgi:FdrA protein